MSFPVLQCWIKNYCICCCKFCGAPYLIWELQMDINFKIAAYLRWSNRSKAVDNTYGKHVEGVHMRGCRQQDNFRHQRLYTKHNTLLASHKYQITCRAAETGKQLHTEKHPVKWFVHCEISPFFFFFICQGEIFLFIFFARTFSRWSINIFFKTTRTDFFLLHGWTNNLTAQTLLYRNNFPTPNYCRGFEYSTFSGCYFKVSIEPQQLLSHDAYIYQKFRK